MLSGQRKTPSKDEVCEVWEMFCLEQRREETDDDVPNHHQKRPDGSKDRPEKGQPADGEDDHKDDDDEDKRED